MRLVSSGLRQPGRRNRRSAGGVYDRALFQEARKSVRS
jgi:hypothetical protein